MGQERLKLHAKNARASMTCGRLAYKIIYRGRPYSDYATDVLVEHKNGGTVGDINYRIKFAENRATDYLHKRLKCTGRPPPCGILADKATMKKRAGQMIGMATVCPDDNNLIQTMYFSNDIVKDHSGEGTAKDIVKVVEYFLEKEKLSEQLVAGGFDGQYFSQWCPQVFNRIPLN